MLLLWRKMKMRTVRTDGLLYYADDLVSNGCLVYSYAPDAKEPIVFLGQRFRLWQRDRQRARYDA